MEIARDQHLKLCLDHEGENFEPEHALEQVVSNLHKVMPRPPVTFPAFPVPLLHFLYLLLRLSTKHPGSISQEKDQFGHAKLGGIGEMVSDQLKNIAPSFNEGKKINVIHQKLGYLVRGGDPDAVDSIVPMAYGNLAFDLILKGVHGRLVVLKNGRYDNVPIDVVVGKSKLVNIEKFYNTKRLRPFYHSFEMMPLFIMTSE